MLTEPIHTSYMSYEDVGESHFHDTRLPRLPCSGIGIVSVFTDPKARGRAIHSQSRLQPQDMVSLTQNQGNGIIQHYGDESRRRKEMNSRAI